MIYRRIIYGSDKCVICSGLVGLLLRLALVVLKVAYQSKRKQGMITIFLVVVNCLTRNLLLAITGDGADNGVLLAGHPIHGALDVTLGLCGLVLSLALSMLLTSRSLPGLKAGGIADLERTR
jgi:hypothetical protein